MTNVQQVESSRSKTRKRGRARKQHSEPTEIKYDDEAIAQGKKLVKALDSSEMKLGELADRLQPRYGKKTLARFAEDIGTKVATLNRCRSVYRAFKGIEAPEPKFAVLKALQAHPLRDQIIKEQPNLTKREATTMMRDWYQGHGEDEDWRVNETRRWFAEHGVCAAGYQV